MKKRYFFVLLPSVLLCLAPMVSEAATLTHRWQFDGSLNDSVGSSNGTAIGNAAAGTTNGVVGGAVSFDGGDDAVSINNAVLGAGAFSIVYWAKEVSPNVGYHMSDGSDVGNLFIRRFKNDGSPYSSFAGNIGDTPINAHEFGFDLNGNEPPEANIPYDTWYQHAITLDPSGTAKWYVDGNLLTQTPGHTWSGLTSSLYLGNRQDLERDLDGLMDDLQIYSGAISASQAQYLHDNPGSTIPEPGTMALLISSLAALVVYAWRKRR